jgi:hypothetical protein
MALMLGVHFKEPANLPQLPPPLEPVLKMESSIRIRLIDENGDAQPVYKDKVFSEEKQKKESLNDSDSQDTSLPHGWLIDTKMLSQSSTGAAKTSSVGVSASGFMDTANYGVISASLSKVGSSDFSQYRLDNSQREYWRIEQRDFYLTKDIKGSHQLGQGYTFMPSMSRGSGRLNLVSQPMEGAGGEWKYKNDISVNAAKGDWGLASYSTKSLDSFGGQYKLTGNSLRDDEDHTAIGFQSIEIMDKGGAVSLDPLTANNKSFWIGGEYYGKSPWADDISGAGSLSKRVGGLKVQSSFIQSQSDGINVSRGLSTDAYWRTNSLQHHASVYRFEPGLRWGMSGLPSDQQGASLRSEYETKKWSMGVNVEFGEKLSSLERQDFVSAHYRRRLDEKNTFFMATALRDGINKGVSNQIIWDKKTSYGITQINGEVSNGESTKLTKLGLDQQWNTVGSKISTGASTYRTTVNGVSSSVLELGTMYSSAIGQARIEMNFRGGQSIENTAQGTSSQYLNLNTDVIWPISKNLSIVSQLNINKGKTTTFVDPMLSPSSASGPNVLFATGTLFMISLRYQENKGRPSAPLGGFYGSGAGSVRGIVFMDNDKNSVAGSSESGVQDVSIVLDGRFATKTDRFGRFEFPYVSAGEHRIEVIPDNIPLPWALVKTGQEKIEVQLREETTYDVPLQRLD